MNARLAPSARRSVEVILAGQSPTGGYVASPRFEQYRYSWLRDGAFIADAMRESGQLESADRFFDWCARVVLARPEGPWDARYTLDGEPDASEWPKLQLDGPGLWLWAMRRRGSSRWEEAAAHVRRYLAAHWGDTSIDWWEEREGVHAATLWCIAEGLDSDEIRGEALRLAEGRLDGSLLFIGTPEIAERAEQGLLAASGGVHRHTDDTYYGGGEWLLLTAILGLVYASHGRVEDARERLAWIEGHATPDGLLPEQSQDHLLHPECYEPWVEKWGDPPCPLLWSHAMHLRLCHAVGHA